MEIQINMNINLVTIKQFYTELNLFPTRTPRVLNKLPSVLVFTMHYNTSC